MSDFLDDSIPDLSATKLLALSAKLEQAAKRKFQSAEDYEPKVYMSFEEGVTTYGHILNTGATANEAFKHTSEVHDKPEGWVDDIKNRKFFYAREVVKHFDDHPMQAKMMKDGIMDRHSLTTSNTMNQQARKLSRQVRFQNAWDDLNEEVESLQYLKVENLKNVAHIESLQELLDHHTDPKSLAVLMHSQGYTKTFIAKDLGVNRKTVTRWVSEAEKDSFNK